MWRCGRVGKTQARLCSLTLPHLRHPVRPETERRTAIRQTVPTKAPVEAETSTLISEKVVYLKNFILNL